MLENLKAKMRDAETLLESLPLEVAKAIRTEADLTSEQKKEAIELVRGWVAYVEKNCVSSDDVYILRAHLEAFSEQFMRHEEAGSAFEIIETDFTDVVLPGGQPFLEKVAEVTDPEILTDKRTVVYGGVARALLKVLASRDRAIDESLLTSEFPLSDIDYMVIKNSEYRNFSGAISHLF
jgi:hypothetical protein